MGVRLVVAVAKAVGTRVAAEVAAVVERVAETVVGTVAEKVASTAGAMAAAMVAGAARSPPWNRSSTCVCLHNRTPRGVPTDRQTSRRRGVTDDVMQWKDMRRWVASLQSLPRRRATYSIATS